MKIKFLYNQPEAGNGSPAPADTFGSFGDGDTTSINHGQNNIGFNTAGQFSQHQTPPVQPPAPPNTALPFAGQQNQQPQPTGPQFSPQEFARLAAEAMRQYQGQIAPPQTPSKPKYATGAHWQMHEGETGPDAFAQRFETAVSEATQQALLPMQQEIATLRDALVMLNGSKAVDPGFQAVESRVHQILSSGVTRDIQAARYIAELERKTQQQQPHQTQQQPRDQFGQFMPGGQFQAPSFPHPVPTPPPHAQSPTTRAPGSSVPQFDPKTRPNIMNIMEGLLKQGGYVQ